MNRKLVLTLTLTLLVGMLNVAFNIQPVKSEPRTWTVDDDGPADFSSIQEAINSPQVVDGDTIFVYNGTYCENVVVNKTISLIGEKDLTIVDGNYTGDVFYVVANNVFLSGFKIQHSGNYEAVLISYSNGSVLTDNLIRGGKGVSLVSSNNNTLENNTIYGGSPHCINLQNSSENAIIRNSIEWAFMDSIRLEYSNNNTVVRNNITYNSQGSGLALHNSSSNILRENRIDNVFRAAVALFSNSSHNLVEYNVAINGRNHGIICGGGSSNVIRGNYIVDNYYQGISLELADYNTIEDNTITRNAIAELYDSSGISLEQASHNILERNNITANKHHGIRLASSSNNVLRDNVMASNGYNFGVFGQELSDFINDVDASNTVDGKPVYYWINKHDQEVPQDAGYVALINSTNITIENLISGVSLAYTENSKIQNITATNSYYGIQLDWSLNNSITSSNITKNCFGILLYSSSKNNIVENNITNDNYGIYLLESSNNTIYHNNFINNTNQVYVSGELSNVWDNGYPSGGNYWSDYVGVDSDPDGIGDTEYVIDTDNIDHYPLMGMFSDFDATLEQGVQTICNSSISDFQSDNTSISFNVTGEDGTAGFCRICIPTALMNATYRVFVNGTETQCNLLPCSNSTHSYLYFTYSHSTKEIIIIPELTSLIILPLFMIATLIIVTIFSKKRIDITQRAHTHSLRVRVWCV